MIANEPAQGGRIRVEVPPDVWDLAPRYIAARQADVLTIRDAVSRADFACAQQLGHKMRGTGGGYGLGFVTQAGEGIERAARLCNAIEVRRWTAELEAWLSHVEPVRGVRPPESAPAPVPAVRRKITLVEDDEDSRVLVRELLGRTHEMAAYASPTEALDGMRKRLPDVAIFDVSLPGMDGLELLGEVRKDPALAALPVIALTAHAMAGDEERILAAGFDAYVTKPLAKGGAVLLREVERLAKRETRPPAVPSRCPTPLPCVKLSRNGDDLPGGFPSGHRSDTRAHSLRALYLRDYLQLFEPYFRSATSDPPTKDGLTLGQNAVRLGLGIGDVTGIHREALRIVLHRDPSAPDPGAPSFRAADFLAACLSPFERIQQECQEANLALARLNQTLGEQAELLRQARREAEEADGAKSQFLASMSHELRTPLHSILGFSEILVRGTNSVIGPKERDFLARIHANASHLLGLVDAILDLSKIETGWVPIEITTVSLTRLVTEILEDMRGPVGTKPIRLVSEVPEGLSPIRTDGGKLKQVLINLVGNAVKFTEEGSITVRVVADAKGRRPQAIEVVDTGIGIPANRRSAIFEPFVQADGTKARKHGGTGLGLTISARLVDLLGGRIDVESEENRGSTFRIVLPDDVPLAEPPAAEARYKGRTAVVAARRGDARALLVHYLEERGLDVSVAEGAAEALGLVQDRRPDMLFFDATDAWSVGLEVWRALQADPRAGRLSLVALGPVAEDLAEELGGRTDLLVMPIVRERLDAVLKARLVPRILIVDDDVVVSRLVSRILSQDGMQAQVLHRGSEALDALRTGQYDLVLLDLVMPEMDGHQFLEELAADPQRSQIPILVLTAKGLAPREQRKLEAVTQGILQKDKSLLDTLLPAVREALRSSASGQPRAVAAE